MLDFRIYTFLKLCDLMNYRLTSVALNITQPAVTQHIQYLEKEYGCKLFEYNGKKIYKTEAAIVLERYARSAKYNDINIRSKLINPTKRSIKIGATKSIGDYVIADNIVNLAMRNDIELTLIIDNTQVLLKMLDDTELDIALIEGFFDKEKYDYELMNLERFVGICSNGHPFAQKEISIDDLFTENTIIRESGSGTRAIFEQILEEHNYSLKSFSHISFISSFEIIKKLVKNNCGISFVFDAVAKSDNSIETFTIKNTDIYREFNYVYLKNTNTKDLILSNLFS